MIERIRVALRPWANAFTAAERRECLRGLLDQHNAIEAGEDEVASWHYEPSLEDIPDAPRDKVQLGNHAKRLLDDPVLRLAFEHVRADLMKGWSDTRVEDREKREDAFLMARALDGLEHKLRRFTGNAAMIAAEMRRKEEAQSRS